MYIEKIPPALLDDITANRCIPFIGAGFSKNANSNNGVQMPDWKELGERVSTYMLDSEFDSAVEALSQYENLYSRANLIEILAKELHVNEMFPGETHLSFCRLYFDIICTTNFDFLLEAAFGEIYSKQGKPYHVITNESRLSTFFNEKTTILKLHGDFNDPNSMVITETDYDLFINKNPLFCTYIANLLITRTPLLIGYSLNDPDIRMLWSIIGSRLNTLRRTGYAIMCNASDNDITRFKRRGINVISLPTKGENYGSALAKLFSEILEYWDKSTENAIKTSNEDAVSVLKFPNVEQSDLCFFSVPYSKLSLYKKYIFPVVERQGFIPVAADEFILAGDNIAAKVSTLIQKAKTVIVDISGSPHIQMELGIAMEEQKACLIISENGELLPVDVLNHQFVVGNFTDKLDNLIDAVDKFIGKYTTNRDDSFDAPKRLFKLKEYNASIIAAISLLEIRLTKFCLLHEKNELSSNAVIPLGQLIRIIGNKYGIDSEQVHQWSSIRNQVAHSEYMANRSQCKQILDGIYNLIARLDNM